MLEAALFQLTDPAVHLLVEQRFARALEVDETQPVAPFDELGGNLLPERFGHHRNRLVPLVDGAERTARIAQSRRLDLKESRKPERVIQFGDFNPLGELKKFSFKTFGCQV